jgi:hypothetical protein
MSAERGPRSQLERDHAAGLVDFDDEGKAYSVSSWAPLDMTTALMGEGVREPEFLARSDGVRLLYPGRRHAFWGPSETFKSWLALLACKQVVAFGGRVVYLDFEDDEVGFVDRSRTLGIPDELVGREIVYVHPEEPLKPARGGSAGRTASLLDFAHLLSRHPDLVILDGVTEAMTLNGLNPYLPDATAMYQHLLVRPWNGAVVEVDHTGGGKEGRPSRTGQLGSQQKRAGLDGISVEFVKERNEGRGGHSITKLYLRKDRHGQVRKHLGGKEFIGRFHLLTVEGFPHEAYIDPAVMHQPAREAVEEIVSTEIKVLEFLQQNPGAKTRDVKAAKLGSWDDVDAVLKGDRVRVEEGPRRARLHYVE